MSNTFKGVLNMEIVTYDLIGNETLIVNNCNGDMISKMNIDLAWKMNDTMVYSNDEVIKSTLTGRKRKTITITMKQKYMDLLI